MKLFDELKWRGLIQDVSSPKLEEMINNGGLTFYIGTDPTAESMHIGHYSSFSVAKRLADGGHKPILLVGGATGLIGDPKPNSERPMIAKEELDKNYKGLRKQVEDIFGFEVVNNYDWSKDINFIDYLRDYGKYFSVNYMLDKDIIKRRLDTGITYTEFSYMIMQALDFEYLFINKKCTMQVAGSDQWGNITAGIDLIRKKHGKEAYGFTMPLITDKLGNKFGKTEGNALWLDINKTSGYELYQFLYNSDDEMVINYLKMLTFLNKEQIDEIEKQHLKTPEKRIAQEALAKEVITFLHGEAEFLKAREISEKLFDEAVFELSAKEIISSLKGIPSFNIIKMPILINEFLVEYNICSSKREVREMIDAGAIQINNIRVGDYNLLIDSNLAIENKVLLIKKGKKNYFLGILN